MKVFLLEEKKTGALMSFYCSADWVDQSKGDDNYIYSAQGYHATDPCYKTSINTHIKALLYYIEHYMTYSLNTSPPNPLFDILKNCEKYCKNHGIDPKNWRENKFFALEFIQKYVRVKIVDLFTGDITYEDIKPFLSKKLQKELT